MRDISKEELDIILDKHAKWLADKTKGERANLSFADLRDADLRYANLSDADLSDANLSYADLRSADLSYANLSSANLSSADLRYADLRSANLSYANLLSANLSDADLRDADLRSAEGQYYITQRSDGYQFFFVLDESGVWMIRAGCQYRSIEDYREHVKTYADAEKKTETTLILDFAEAKLNAILEKQEKAA